MADRYPVPTASPLDDIEQYIGLLLAAIDEALDRPDVWPEGEEDTALGYIEDLKLWVSLLTSPAGYLARILETQTTHLISCWPLSETSGTNADNAQGTAARDGTYTNGVTLNAATFTDGTPVPSFDGSNDCVNVYSSSLNAAFNGQEFSVLVWGRVSAGADWTDGSQHRLFELAVDGVNNLFVIGKSANNTISVTYLAGGTNKVRSFTITSTDWFNVIVTVSKSVDAVKVYLNGAQQGATLTGLGTWSGTLNTANCVIGAATNTGVVSWKGNLKHTALWGIPLSDAEIATLSTVA